MLGRNGFLRAIRQRGGERRAVGFGGHARIGDQYDSRVGGGPNQASEALSEFDDGLGQLEVAKGVAASLSDRFEACLEQRMVRDAKRQLGYDDQFERIARHIDSLPKALGTEKDPAWMLFEGSEEFGSGCSIGLRIRR